MPLDDDWDGDLEEITEDMAATFEWDGHEYAALITPLSSRARAEELLGYGVDVDFEILVRTRLFEDGEPEVTDLVTIAGTQYRIQGMAPTETDDGLRLFVKHKDELNG